VPGSSLARILEVILSGHSLELPLADVSELILCHVHKQQNRRKSPINFELVFRNSLLSS
jgi:hypothetical protein